MGKRKKYLLLIVFTFAALCVATWIALPSIAKKVISAKAQKHGWSASVAEIRVGWFKIDAKGLVASSVDGTRQVKLNELQAKLNSKLDLESVTAQGGTVSVLGPWKSGDGKKNGGSNNAKIHVNGVDVDWGAVDGGSASARAKMVNAELDDGVLKVSAQTVVLESNMGKVVANLATLRKDTSGMTASAANVVASLKDVKIQLSDVEVKKFVAKPGHAEVSMSAQSAQFPKELSASGMKADLTADVDADKTTVDFHIGFSSVTGQHRAIADKSIKTSQMSAEGRFEAKTFASDWGPVHDWDLNAQMKFDKASAKIEVERQRNKEQNLWIFSATLERTPCQDVLEAIPKAMRPELDGVVFNGDMEGNVTVQTLEGVKDLHPFVHVRLEHKCKVVSVPNHVADALAGKPFKRQIYSSSGEMKEVTSGYGRSGWVSFLSISPYMAKAVVTTEDPGFWGHHGFDMEAIRNSLAENVKDRKFTRGASTIPMQLAKNMFLSRDKTATRKLQEFFLTMVVDQKMTKDRILEMYLNIIEFGPNLYGIGPAAHFYFDENPSQLSLGQAVFLSSILPKPRAIYFSPDGALNDGKRNQVVLILDLMQRRGSITDEECKLAKEETITFGNDRSDQSHRLDVSDWETQ